MTGVLQVEMLEQRRQIVGVGIHVVTVPRLAGAAMAPAVMRDDAISVMAEEEHLGVPERLISINRLIGSSCR